MDQNKITFNKSTLLSLKAELFRKQEEVKQKKTPQYRESLEFRSLPKKFEPDVIKEKVKELAQTDVELREACMNVREKLEKKSRIYDALLECPEVSKYSDQYLVQFAQKQQESIATSSLVNYEVRVNERRSSTVEDDSEWMDFTDCLGRTRKCHKLEIEHFRRRDRELLKSMGITVPTDQCEYTSSKETQPQVPSATKLIVEKTGDLLRQMREKWEEQERALQNKDSDIHYQDLLFDEARQHGVGYFNFSTDEVLRRKQQEELDRRRKETLKEQAEVQELRSQRDQLIADRVNAAKARRRARAGLPPEEDKKDDLTTSLLDFITKQKEESSEKAKQELQKAREKQEEVRKKIREEYVREWDRDKKDQDKATSRILTQEEYVDRERAKRMKEFAPPVEKPSKSDQKFDSTGKSTTKTWTDVRPVKPQEPAPEEENKSLYFTSKRKQRNLEVRNEFQNEMEEGSSMVQRELKKKGVEIEPPAMFEYYTPEYKRRKHSSISSSSMSESFDQGLQNLKSRTERKGRDRDLDFI